MGALPREKFLNRQIVSPARLLQADHAVAHGWTTTACAPHDPALGIGRRQSASGQPVSAGTLPFGQVSGKVMCVRSSLSLPMPNLSRVLKKT